MSKALSWAIGAAIALAASPALAGEAEDRAELQALNAKWLQSYVSNDGKALSEVLADEFVAIHPRTGARRTKAELVSDVSKGAYGITRMEWRDLVVTVHGDTAIVTGVSRITRKSGETGENRYLDVYARQGGKWRAVAAQVTRLTGGQ